MRGGLPVVGPNAVLDLSPFPQQPKISGPAGIGIRRGSSLPLYRAINDIVAHVTVDEDHDDELVITEHPVEYGAAITDHAYKRPSEVRVRVGWSEAGGLPNQHSEAISDVRTVYDKILALQMQRNPFTLYTGKKTYRNMLVASVRLHTDAKFETSFIADITLREILLVSTQKIPVNNNALASPESNSAPVDNGDKQAKPTTLTPKQYDQGGGQGSEGDDFGGGEGSGFGGGSEPPTVRGLWDLRGGRGMRGVWYLSGRTSVGQGTYPPTIDQPDPTPTRAPRADQRLRASLYLAPPATDSIAQRGALPLPPHLEYPQPELGDGYLRPRRAADYQRDRVGDRYRPL